MEGLLPRGTTTLENSTKGTFKEYLAKLYSSINIQKDII